MDGVVELAEEIFHMPVRLGYPQYITGLSDVVRNPIYATGVGLLLFGRHNRESGRRSFNDNSGIKSIWSRMKSWFQGNF